MAGRLGEVRLMLEYPARPPPPCRRGMGVMEGCMTFELVRLACNESDEVFGLFQPEDREA